MDVSVLTVGLVPDKGLEQLHGWAVEVSVLRNSFDSMGSQYIGPKALGITCMASI